MEKGKTLYYKDNHGHIWEGSEIEEVFSLVTGKYRFQDENGYLKFLYSLLGKTILRVGVWRNDKMQAIKEYRENNGCSLSEAHKAITEQINDCFN